MDKNTILIAEDGKTEIPLCDIDRFQIYHENYQNGDKLQAFIKIELCTVISNETSEIIKEGKYKEYVVYEHDIYCSGSRLGSREKLSREIRNSFKILGKYNKCRTKLMKQIKEEGELKINSNMVMTGINSGYAVHNKSIVKKMEGEKQ